MNDNEDQLTPLIDRLLDEDSEARYETAREISRMGRPVLACVLELSTDPRPRMREMACYILGQIGDRHPDGWVTDRYPDGIPALLHCLESDPDEDVRDGAAAALGHHGAPSTLPALCRAASAPSPQ